MRTLSEQAAAVAAGQVSPVELVEEALRAIDRVQVATNAFTVVLGDQAIDEAKRLADRAPTGPLHGVPIAVKDLFDVAGAPTSGCTKPYEGRVARRNSAVVEALRAAGAIVVAKTNQHELATGATTAISSFGPVTNPWRAGATAGGSSGGSGAAVASRAVLMTMGSDTGGSVRIPASFCGVTGLKPTHGAVSLRGAMPLAPSLDTAGPLAVSAADCRLVFEAIAGFDPDDVWSSEAPPITGQQSPRRRVAVATAFLRVVHPETKAAVEAAARAFEDLGVQVDEIEGPDPFTGFGAGGPIMVTEFAHHYRDLWDNADVHPQVRGLLEFGRSVSGPDHAANLAAARQVRRDFEWALTAADALLVPGTPYPAPQLDADMVDLAGGEQLDVHMGGPARNTFCVNVAGLPAVAFPAGFSSDGLPLGAQLIGRPWSEDVLLGLVDAYQLATDWHLRTPA